MPKICPEYIKGVQVVQGDWEAVGSIKLWTYVAGIYANKNNSYLTLFPK